METQYLAHFGIKGMKWGVRRYQNPDGTLTEAGRKRYGKQLYREAKSVSSLKKSDQRRREFVNKSRKFIDENGFESYYKVANSSNIQKAQKFLQETIAKGIYLSDPARGVMLNVAAEIGYEKVPYNPKAKTLKERYPNAGRGWDSDEHEYNAKLGRHIAERSINWYESEPKSAAFKKLFKERGYDPKNGIYPHFDHSENDKILGMVLKDLDLPNTAENRKIIEPYVFWD